MSDRALDILIYLGIIAMLASLIILIAVVVTQHRPHHKDTRPVCGRNYKAVSVKPIIYKWVPVHCDLALKNP